MAAAGKKAPRFKVLVADDEADIHQLTKMTLKKVTYQDRKIRFLSAMSGEEAVEAIRENPDTAVILLDVVMESDHAGLDACKAIREDLGNHMVRILLRTGQPGAAPERTVVTDYDIDGYLPKADLTSMKLFTAVRTALKAHSELVELQRHRDTLETIHNCVIEMHSYQPVEYNLELLAKTASDISGASLTVLQLETFEHEGNPQLYFLYRGNAGDETAQELAAEQIRHAVQGSPSARSATQAIPFEDGYLIPIRLDHDLGFGWLYLQISDPDRLLRHGLGLLAAQGANAVYAASVQALLSQSGGEDFDQLDI